MHADCGCCRPEEACCSRGVIQDDLGGRNRVADHIALDSIAAEFVEQFEGGSVLNPLGDDLETQRVAELDGRPDKLGVA